MFSLELPKNVTEIGNHLFNFCYCLRNVAILPNAKLSDNIFIFGTGVGTMLDLRSSTVVWFGKRHYKCADASILNGLPVHKLIYYHSYHQEVLQNLIGAINLRSCQSQTLHSKLDPTGNQQDCLGMIPLHISTCSSIHDIELFTD